MYIYIYMYIHTHAYIYIYIRERYIYSEIEAMEMMTRTWWLYLASRPRAFPRQVTSAAALCLDKISIAAPPNHISPSLENRLAVLPSHRPNDKRRPQVGGAGLMDESEEMVLESTSQPGKFCAHDVKL